MNSIEQCPGVFSDEAEKHLGCQLLNKTNEVPNMSAEFLEMEYLMIIPPEMEDSKRHVKNETIPKEEVKAKKSLPPSFLYILSLIVQQNPFSFHYNIRQRTEHDPAYYIINRCDNCRST